MATDVRLFRRDCRLPAGARLAGRVAVSAIAAALVVVSVAGGDPLYVAIAAWPVAALAAGADTPMLPSRAGAFIRLGGAVVAVLGAGMVNNIVSTPILPSTVVVVAPPGAATTKGKPDTDVSRRGADAIRRGYVVSIDDESTTMLLDNGGIAIIANDDIRSRISCPSVTDLPAHSPRLGALPVRESVLRHLARRQRPAVVQDPRCRFRPDTWNGS
jgi:hypothetical protein